MVQEKKLCEILLVYRQVKANVSHKSRLFTLSLNQIMILKFGIGIFPPFNFELDLDLKLDCFARVRLTR